MYTDSGNFGTNRDGWKFTYKGKDLLPFAAKLVELYASIETKQRDTMVTLMGDRKIATNSKQVDSCKRLLVEAGIHHEKCIVYVHEFKREPEREYHLTIGDVVYFGITGEKASLGDNE